MANTIREYTAPDTNLLPTSSGATAYEQAGRRLGPLYNEAATFQRRQGAVNAEGNKQLLWPLDILKMYDKAASEELASTASTSKSGGSSRIRFGKDDGFASRPLNTDYSKINADDLDSNGQLKSSSLDANGQIVLGAGALGRVVADGAKAVGSTDKYAGTTYEWSTGKTTKGETSQTSSIYQGNDNEVNPPSSWTNATTAKSDPYTQTDFGGGSEQGYYGYIGDLNPKQSYVSGVINSLSSMFYSGGGASDTVY